jgi:hypothetical protein
MNNYTTSLVIATRNRKTELSNLLYSLSKCSVKPDIVAIVSSGNEIYSTLKKFDNEINIICSHVKKAGQVFQRQCGLDLLNYKSDITIFLDDDVIIPEDFFLLVINFFKEKKDDIGGLGFNLKNQEICASNRDFQGKPDSQNKYGKVLKDGRAIDYTDSEKVINVEWLNGLSAWRTKVLLEFKHPPIKNTYAACEDLIFSFEVGRVYKLYFDPKIVLLDQNEPNSEEITFEKYKTWWQHKLYFVLVNKEMSLRKFKISIIKELLVKILTLYKLPKKQAIQKIKFYLKILFYIHSNKGKLLNNDDAKKYLIQNLL